MSPYPRRTSCPLGSCCLPPPGPRPSRPCSAFCVWAASSGHTGHVGGLTGHVAARGPPPHAACSRGAPTPERVSGPPSRKHGLLCPPGAGLVGPTAGAGIGASCSPGRESRGDGGGSWRMSGRLPGRSRSPVMCICRPVEFWEQNPHPDVAPLSGPFLLWVAPYHTHCPWDRAFWEMEPPKPPPFPPCSGPGARTS